MPKGTVVSIADADLDELFPAGLIVLVGYTSHV
jgi:hypothetical protein